ncbi:MAG: transport-associated protein [Deltaproteobacteria bacterium HGW-Deltaproteobacteria-12]|nr:MAG: transport-associated protein [Deltaproteobacteria bacterium HGW-Deltaproteobacteria-12]
MKTIYRLTVMTVAAVALLALSMPVYASKTDSRIESTAKKSYVFQTYLQGDDIKIESRDGAVTLTGTVADSHHKSLAEETVADLPGVKSVDNKLEIKGAPPITNSDAYIRDKVKYTLLFHRSLNTYNPEVDVKDGIVTLRGETNTQVQKNLSTEYARDVEGVKDVKNEMTIAKTPKKTQTVGSKIDDSSITAQVKMALLYHRSTSAINTKVTTKSGVVTLTGKAKNAAEKDLAARYANDVNGVKSVKNKMTIE